MGVHPDGSGTGWSLVEAVDVDQPHGLDYRLSSHIAIGVRKRINKEHVAFGDNTAGGEHIPGGCAVVALTDTTADITKGHADGTFIGKGLIYDLASARFACYTEDGTSGDSSDPYYLTLGPGSLCKGGDYTWTGGHEFDGSVDFTQTVVFCASVDIQGELDASNTLIDGTLTVLDRADFSVMSARDISISGDMFIEGTLNVNSQADFSALHATGIVSLFGSVKTTDSDGAALDATGSTYRVSTDGFLTADGSTNASSTGVITAYVGDNTTPATVVARNKVGSLNASDFIFFPIAKNKYFAISQVDVTEVVVRWTPVGDGSCEKI